MERGLSVVVATWNGARRLSGTLAALLLQRPPPGLRWEVILVDNASSDDSAGVARAAWPRDAPAPLRVVPESRPGLRHANERGLAEARYDLIGLVNDDNGPQPGWLGGVVAFMEAHPQAAAVGARGIAVPEVAAPAWFEGFQKHYAVGAQAEQAGPLTAAESALWGASTTYRVAAWRDLAAGGFAPHQLGRRGAQLSAGEDYELAYALRLAGWELWYEPGLVFEHRIPAQRLNWRWHRKMQRGFGAAIAHDAYVLALRGSASSLAEVASAAWVREAATALFGLLRFAPQFLLGDRLPGDPAVARADQLYGRLRALLAWRSRYDRCLLAIRTAPWRRSASGISSAS